MHEVHFQGHNNYDFKFVQIVSFCSSFECARAATPHHNDTTDKVSSPRRRTPCAHWPWRLRHLPPSSAVEGSAAAGWCLSATSTGQEGPLKKEAKAKQKKKVWTYQGAEFSEEMDRNDHLGWTFEFTVLSFVRGAPSPPFTRAWDRFNRRKLIQTQQDES